MSYPITPHLSFKAESLIESVARLEASKSRDVVVSTLLALGVQASMATLRFALGCQGLGHQAHAAICYLLEPSLQPLFSVIFWCSCTFLS